MSIGDIGDAQHAAVAQQLTGGTNNAATLAVTTTTGAVQLPTTGRWRISSIGGGCYIRQGASTVVSNTAAPNLGAWLGENCIDYVWVDSGEDYVAAVTTTGTATLNCYLCRKA